MIDSITAKQGAIIAHVDGEHVIITAHELRLIARGLHAATDEQTRAIAQVVTDRLNCEHCIQGAK